MPKAVRVPDSNAPRPRQLPAVVGDFTGRARELDALGGLVERTRAGILGGIPVVVVTGTAGVGKTTLVNHLSQRVRDCFPDGHLYVNMRGFDEAGQAMTAGEALHRFLDALQALPPAPRAVPVDQAGLFRTLLAGRRVLIVLDNVRDAAQVRPLLPGSQGSLVLVISRSQLTGLAADGAHVLQMRPFTDGEACEMLDRRIGPGRTRQHPQAAGELIRICAGLPLGLSVAAAQAATSPGCPLRALAGEMQQGRLDWLETGDPDTSVRTVLSWSYQHLGQQAARMFRLLSVQPGPDISVLAAASLAAVPARRARGALDQLARASLLEEHASGRFACHDLLRRLLG